MAQDGHGNRRGPAGRHAPADTERELTPRLPSNLLPSRLPSISFEPPVAVEDRFWQWRDTLASLFDVAIEWPEALGTFDAHLRVHAFDGFLAMRIGGTAQFLRRSAVTVARSRVDHYLLRAHASDGCTILTAGRRLRTSRGDVSILDLALPVDITTTGFDDVAFVLPRAVLLPLADRADVLHGFVMAGHLGLGPILGAHMRRLCAEADHLTPPEAQKIAAGTLALLVSLVGRAVENAAVAEAASALLVAIRVYIERELASPTLCAAALMQTFNVSRPTLYRIFSPLGGVAAYIRDRRLARILQTITMPGQMQRRIGDIACDWGFSNEGSFSRAFGRAFGLSPREARVAATHSEAVESSSIAGATIGKWLRDLSVPAPLRSSACVRRDAGGTATPGPA